MKHTLNSTRVTYNEDGFTLQLINAQLRTLSKDVIAKATHNKEYHIGFHCKHMGAHATLFKSCPAIVIIGFHSANFKQVSVMPGPPSIICTLNASTKMHWCTLYHKRQHFFSCKRFSASLLMTAQSILILIATDMMHSNNQCQQSNFCLETVFFAKSKLFYWTNNGLAMINGATMPLQITEKTSFNTTASTKAVMVQNRYQA
jgi:hypothetical protein